MINLRSDSVHHKVPVGCFRRKEFSEKHQGTLERKFSEILELYNFPFMLMLTYTCSWKCWTVYFTFTIWSGEPAFMNSSQLLPISDTFLWAITFWIFLIINLSLLIPSWSSPPSFQVIIITVICVITTFCTEQKSDVHYSIKAKLPHRKNIGKFPNSDSFLTVFLLPYLYWCQRHLYNSWQ